VASAAAEPALAEADAEPFDGDRGGGAELLPASADTLGAQAHTVRADAVAVAVEVVDALVLGVCLAEDRVGLVCLPQWSQASEVVAQLID
jgi:hypothetical protein